MNDYIKSPIVYQGSKYKLLKHIIPALPKNIDAFIDLFGGSGTVAFNVEAKRIYYNDSNYLITELLLTVFNNQEKVINHIKNMIERFNLIRCDKKISKEDDIYKLAYENYNKFREYANKSENNNILNIFVLHLFSINNLIRFNKKGDFNASYGSYTGQNLTNAIEKIKKLPTTKNISFLSRDFRKILEKIINEGATNENLFIYLDPPYSHTTAVYNENCLTGWNVNDDKELYEYLDKLNELNIKWMLSSTTKGGKNGIENKTLIEWMKKYNIKNIDMKYGIFGKSNIKDLESGEVIITNYEN